MEKERLLQLQINSWHLEARRRAVEEEFEKAIDQAKNVGLSNDEILEIVTLLLDEA